MPSILPEWNVALEALTPSFSSSVASTTISGLVKIATDDPDPVALLASEGLLREPPGAPFRFSGGNELQWQHPTTGEWWSMRPWEDPDGEFTLIMAPT